MAMRTLSVLFSVLLASSLLLGDQKSVSTPHENDSYSVGFVESAVQLVKRVDTRGGSSWEMKSLTSLRYLGDRVSIAMLKIFRVDEITEPQNAEACLTIIRNAFSDRRVVSDDSDKDSRITLFLLDYLQQNEISNPGIEKRIEYLKQCVKDFTCTSEGEYNYWHRDEGGQLGDASRLAFTSRFKLLRMANGITPDHFGFSENTYEGPDLEKVYFRIVHYRSIDRAQGEFDQRMKNAVKVLDRLESKGESGGTDQMAVIVAGEGNAKQRTTILIHVGPDFRTVESNSAQDVLEVAGEIKSDEKKREQNAR
jgi:hypothetical protein